MNNININDKSIKIFKLQNKDTYELHQKNNTFYINTANKKNMMKSILMYLLQRFTFGNIIFTKNIEIFTTGKKIYYGNVYEYDVLLSRNTCVNMICNNVENNTDLYKYYSKNVYLIDYTFTC